jgi:hypothetical protein
MSGSFSIIEGDVVLYDANGVAHSICDGVAIPADTPSLIVSGRDAQDYARNLVTDGEGVLKVSSQPPKPPPGTTPFALAVDEADLEIGAPPAYHEEESAVIGSGVNLYLQTFFSGAAGDPNERGSRVDLLWREGAGPTDHIVSRMYIGGQSVSFTLPDLNKARDGTALTGDASTTKLVIRRYRLSNADSQVDVDVRGYMI